MDNEQRQELITTLGQKFPTITEEQCERVTDAVAEWYAEQNTFTDNVTMRRKSCPTCGSIWVIYKKSFDKHKLKALKILFEKNRPMKSKEIFEASGNDRIVFCNYTFLMLWGLIEKQDESMYMITEAGRQFIRGELGIPEFVYTLKGVTVPTPAGEREPRMISVDQVTFVPGMKPSEYVDEAIPVPHDHHA